RHRGPIWIHCAPMSTPGTRRPRKDPRKPSTPGELRGSGQDPKVSAPKGQAPAGPPPEGAGERSGRAEPAPAAAPAWANQSMPPWLREPEKRAGKPAKEDRARPNNPRSSKDPSSTRGDAPPRDAAKSAPPRAARPAA